jgi:hypothetical protein
MPDVSKEIAVPFRFDADGTLAVVDNDAQLIEQRIKSIIMTRVGERIMLPTYGTPTTDYLFEIDDPIATTELAGFVERSIKQWEPSVHIKQVLATVSDAGVMQINVSYSVSPREDVHSTIVSIGGSIQDVIS